MGLLGIFPNAKISKTQVPEYYTAYESPMVIWCNDVILKVVCVCVRVYEGGHVTK